MFLGNAAPRNCRGDERAKVQESESNKTIRAHLWVVTGRPVETNTAEILRQWNLRGLNFTRTLTKFQLLLVLLEIIRNQCSGSMLFPHRHCLSTPPKTAWLESS